MSQIGFLPIAAEVFLAVGAILVLMAAVTLDLGRRAWAIIAGLSLALSFGVAWVQWWRLDDVGAQLNYVGQFGRTPMVVMDYFSAFGGGLVIAAGGIALLGGWRLVGSLRRRGAEYVALVLLAIAGLHIMVISANLIMMFIGLETASIALYIIAGFIRDEKNSDEAATKYFLLGSFASALFLYGVALSYAATGSTSIYGERGIIAFFSDRIILDQGVLLIGIALMIVGLGFKVSAAPFHQWAPDVYQGAPGAAVPLMASGVKIAGFAALARVLTVAFGASIGDWAQVIGAVAALSVVVGTLLAIAQSDFKRMLAYSGVAHAGFMLTSLVAGQDGIPSLWFYLGTYSFQLIGTFLIASIVSGAGGGASPLDQYRGLAKRSPVLGGALAILMLAMGGIPLTAGFIGKVGVFAAAINAGYLWLAIVGLVAAVAGLFFYLRLIVLAYFEDPPAELADVPIIAPRATRIALAVCVFFTFVFGVMPWPLLNLTAESLPLASFLP
jgi:NADH-quinone oxidoreductase subunit N